MLCLTLGVCGGRFTGSSFNSPAERLLHLLCLEEPAGLEYPVHRSPPSLTPSCPFASTHGWTLGHVDSPLGGEGTGETFPSSGVHFLVCFVF